MITRENSPRHRFDSALGDFATGYFATEPEAAFAEVLAPLRARPDQLALLPDDDSMGDSHIDADWRDQRLLAHVELVTPTDRPLVFADVQHESTIAALNTILAPLVARLNRSSLTLSDIHGENRVLTSWAAQAIHDLDDSRGKPLFDGIRYISKYGSSFECWAVFDHVELERVSVASIRRDDPALKKIAELYGLTVF